MQLLEAGSGRYRTSKSKVEGRLSSMPTSGDNLGDGTPHFIGYQMKTPHRSQRHSFVKLFGSHQIDIDMTRKIRPIQVGSGAGRLQPNGQTNFYCAARHQRPYQPNRDPCNSVTKCMISITCEENKCMYWHYGRVY